MTSIPFKIGEFSGILSVGVPTYLIEVNGARLRFEDHHDLRPIPLGTRGNQKHVPERHLFWTAVSYWSKQGKRLDGNMAIWTLPPTTTFYRLDQRTLVDAMTARKLGIMGTAEMLKVLDY